MIELNWMCCILKKFKSVTTTKHTHISNYGYVCGWLSVCVCFEVYVYVRYICVCEFLVCSCLYCFFPLVYIKWNEAMSCNLIFTHTRTHHHYSHTFQAYRRQQAKQNNKSTIRLPPPPRALCFFLYYFTPYLIRIFMFVAVGFVVARLFGEQFVRFNVKFYC